MVMLSQKGAPNDERATVGIINRPLSTAAPQTGKGSNSTIERAYWKVNWGIVKKSTLLCPSILHSTKRKLLV